MRLYRTIYLTQDEEKNASWAGTQADAASKRKELKSVYPGCKPTTEEIDVPTSKAELLAFLNANATFIA